MRRSPVNISGEIVPAGSQARIDVPVSDLYTHVEVSTLQHGKPTSSPGGPGNPLWDVVTTHTQIAYPGAKVIPGIIVGGTDARFYRDRGATAYGAGLYSANLDFAAFGARFHGNDERIDTESLGLSANYFYGIAKELLG